MSDSRLVSYEEAALMIGCTHHWVRMLVGKGRLQIADRIEVRPNVLKVFLDSGEVQGYINSRARRYSTKYRLTREEKRLVDSFVRRIRNESNR